MDDDLFLNITGLRPTSSPPASRDDLIRREQRHQAGNASATQPGKRLAKAANNALDAGSRKGSQAGGAVGKRALETSASQPQLARLPKRIKRSRVADAVPKTGEIEVSKQGVQSEVFDKSASKEHKRSKGSAVPVVAAQTPQEMPGPKTRKKVKGRLDPAASTVTLKAPDPPEKTLSEKKAGGPMERVTLAQGGIPSNADFKKLHLHESLARQLDFLKFTQCTPIQALAVPVALDGRRDVLIRAATGSGKTLAFLLPVLNQLLQLSPAERDRNKGTLALILSPTKELALQTLKVAQDLLRMVPSIVCGVVAGGEKPKSEKARLRKGLSILCATTGRLSYHLENSGSFVTSGLRYLVFDEADRLLDLGFEPQIRRIYKAIKKSHEDKAFAEELMGRKVASFEPQAILVSATLTPEVNRLADFCLRKGAFWADPDDLKNGQFSDKESEGGLSFSVPSTLTQWYCIVPCKERLVALIASVVSRCSGADGRDASKAIVFFSSNASVDFHSDVFKDADWPSIHGFSKPVTSSGKNKVRKLKDGFIGLNPDQEDEEEEEEVVDDEDMDEEEEEEGGAEDFYTDAGKRSAKIFANTPCFKLHGSLDKEERAGYIRDFSSATGGVLLASDAASRGLDFPRIDWIIQYDPPQRIEEYLHRIGRTARIGRTGNALIFLQPSETGFLDALRSHGVSNLKEIKASTLPAALLRCGAPPKVSQARNFEQLLSAHLASFVGSSHALLKMARSAFLSAVCSYRSFPRELRAVFPFRELHMGHFASSFGLREAPEQVSRLMRRNFKGGKGEGKGKGKGGKSKGSQEENPERGSAQARQRGGGGRRAADEFAG